MKVLITIFPFVTIALSRIIYPEITLLINYEEPFFLLEWMTFFTKENLQILDALVEETKRKMSKKQQKREKRIVKKSIINFLNGKDEDVDFTSIVSRSS